MPKFRKKPVVIEAVRASDALRCASRDWTGLPSWLSEAYEVGEIVFASDHISISTLEGTMRADPGDWVIRGVKGEIYPCKADIFTETYEPVEDAS